VDDISSLQIISRLGCAAILGALVGWERSHRDHPAGLRTQIVISAGAAAFIVISLSWRPATETVLYELDPMRVLQGIVQGVGLLAGGAIIKSGRSVKGLTTASSVWAVAAVGAACGFGQFFLALTLTIITLVSTGLLIYLDPKDRTKLKSETE
jgi:putative Mg2+ transporter-C (MgtC) family protein